MQKAKILLQEVKTALDARLQAVFPSASTSGLFVSTDYERELLLLEQALPGIYDTSVRLLKRIKANLFLNPLFNELQEYISYCRNASWYSYVKSQFQFDGLFIHYLFRWERYLNRLQEFLNQLIEDFHPQAHLNKYLEESCSGVEKQHLQEEPKIYRATVLAESQVLEKNVILDWNLTSRNRFFACIMGMSERYFTGIVNLRKPGSKEDPCRFSSDRYTARARNFLRSLK